MNRKERRAVEHRNRKLARKAGFPSPTTITTTVEPPPLPPPPAKEQQPATVAPIDIPEPGIPFPSLASISPARLSANRANAKHSSGPKSEIGRATSSQNHTTHGLARHNGTFVLLPTEDPFGFEALKSSLADEHTPETETESILVQTMAESHWLANRAQTLQSTCFDPQTGQIADAKMFSLYLRYQTTHTRAFHKSLNDLAKLRSERRKADLGFEAQNRKQEEIRIKNEQHEMKKQTHYWDVLRKDGEACFRIGQTLMQNHKAAAENPGFQAQLAAELAQHGLKNHFSGAATSAA